MYDITAIASEVLKTEVFIKLQNKQGKVIITSLLSGNTKLDKSKDVNKGLALLPHDMANNYLSDSYQTNTLCPKATANKCDKICIGEFSGHYSMLNGSAHKAQIKKTIAFLFDNENFSNQLFGELAGLAGIAHATKSKAYIRLDVFSDNKKWNINFISDIQSKLGMLAKHLKFYDYTKLHSHAILEKTTKVNYDIAFSVSRHTLDNIHNTQLQSMFAASSYSAIVVLEDNVAATIDLLNSSLGGYVRAVNGDKFDNFTQWNNDCHTVLVLKAKGTKKSIKKLVADTFSIDEVEALHFYSEVFEYLPIRIVA